MTTAYIALGSNLGDRRENLDRALQSLQDQDGVIVTQVSTYHETEPVGGPPGQDRYLNAAAEVQTELEPADLLQLLLQVEQSLGRVRTEERYGPRTIDLDLLLYGDQVSEGADLSLPHPRLHERLFVLQPLAEIAPQVMHPVLQQTVRHLLERLADQLPEALPAQKEEAIVAPVSVDSQTAIQPPPPAQEASAKTRRELTGLRALVTGSTSGIGRAIALELAAAGADVIIHGRREATARAVAEQVKEAGGRTQFLLADLGEPDQCRRLVEEAWSAWNGLDIWINNAGADTLTGPAADWSFLRKLRELLEVDVIAALLMARDVGRRMKAAGGGVLVNMGWDQAETGMAGDSGELFAASKGAVMAFSKSLALSLAPQVRVNCLAPGWIRTAWGEGASERWQERVRRETPLQRWGTPEDVAAAARWLVSPAAAFLTGQVIRVNGGAVR